MARVKPRLAADCSACCERISDADGGISTRTACREVSPDSEGHSASEVNEHPESNSAPTRPGLTNFMKPLCISDPVFI